MISLFSLVSSCVFLFSLCPHDLPFQKNRAAHVTSRPVGALHWIPFQLEIIHLFGLQNLLSSQPEGPLLGGPLGPLAPCWSWICATVKLEKHGDMAYEIL
jgi:hypothetical protein